MYPLVYGTSSHYGFVKPEASLSISSSRDANGRTPIEIITGETSDISKYLDFGFYDWVVYHSNAGLGELSIGRWLGVSHKIGQLMSYWILTVSGRPISCVNVQRLTEAEQGNDEWESQMRDYDQLLSSNIDAKNTSLSMDDVPDWNRSSLNELDPDFDEEFNKVINDNGIPEADQPDLNAINIHEISNDGYIDMELGMPRGPEGQLLHAKVKRRAIDNDGKPLGVASSNPITDTRLYEIEYMDGSAEVVPANVIAENILSQVDEEGNGQLMIDEIINHRSNEDAVKHKHAFYTTSSGRSTRRGTTKGWELCVQWKDGSSHWVALKDLKNSYPLETADYSIANLIDDQPAFAWWVPYVTRKRKHMIGKVKSKYWQRTH